MDLALADREYLAIYLRADKEKTRYTRISYDMLTYLGDLGGLLDIVLMFGSLCTGFFARKLFQAALIRQAYRIQSYYRDFDQFYQTKQDCILSSSSSESKDDS